MSKQLNNKYPGVTISRAKTLIQTYWTANPRTPIMLLGKTGVGKSELVEELREHYEKELGVEFGLVDYRAGQRESSDLTGALMPTENQRSTFLCPEDIPYEQNSKKSYARERATRYLLKEKGFTQVWELNEKEKVELEKLTEHILENDTTLPGFPEHGILFLDETKHADPSTQKVLYSLVYDGKVGEHKVMKNWKIILASNRNEEQTYDIPIAEPLRARMAHIFIESNVNEWATWAAKTGLRSEVSSFLVNNSVMHKSDPHGEGSFPCGRKWEQVARLLDTIAPLSEEGTMQWVGKDLTGSNNLMAIAGLVGMEAATEFAGFLGLVADKNVIAKYSVQAILDDNSLLEGVIKRANVGVAWALVSRVINYAKIDGYTHEYYTKAMNLFCNTENVFTDAQDIGRYAITNLRYANQEKIQDWLEKCPEATKTMNKFLQVYELTMQHD